MVLSCTALPGLAAKDAVPVPAAAAAIQADSPAIVREWTPPVYPADALKEKVSGRVTTRIIVDETGAITSARVLKTTDPRLGEAELRMRVDVVTPCLHLRHEVVNCAQCVHRGSLLLDRR